MKTTLHLCQSVSGALKNWKKRDWEECGRVNGKTAAQMKEQFRILDFEGVKVLPFGKECEGFSYETGCPGHPAEDSSEVTDKGEPMRTETAGEANDKSE